MTPLPFGVGDQNERTFMLFDTHAHLTDEAFSSDRQELIRYLATTETKKIINCGYDTDSCLAALRLAEQYEYMYAAVGIHPHDAKNYDLIFENQLRQWLQVLKVVALGEIGLDYHYDYSPRDVQKKVFEDQIAIALEYDKPIVVHSREAVADTYDILKSAMRDRLKVVLHSFSQSKEMMKRYLDMGVFFSLSGVITFKNADKLRETVKDIPLDRMFTETDCPYMTPVPHRGKRNDPSYVKWIAEKIAEIKQISYETVCETTCQNAMDFFEIK